jgi:hypothetical protein
VVGGLREKESAMFERGLIGVINEVAAWWPQRCVIVLC